MLTWWRVSKSRWETEFRQLFKEIPVVKVTAKTVSVERYPGSGKLDREDKESYDHRWFGDKAEAIAFLESRVRTRIEDKRRAVEQLEQTLVDLNNEKSL
jgi:hypothetical protein